MNTVYLSKRAVHLGDYSVYLTKSAVYFIEYAVYLSNYSVYLSEYAVSLKNTLYISLNTQQLYQYIGRTSLRNYKLSH